MPKVIPEYKIQAKKRIIEEALKTFSQNGYHETKMIDIASNLGVSKGALYQYFDSKDDLFLAVMEYRIDQRQNDMINFLSSDLNNLALEKFFLENRKKITDSPRFSFDFLTELSRNERLRKKFQRTNDLAREKLLQFFNNLKERGIIKKNTDPLTLIYAFLALRDGLNFGSLYGLELTMAAKMWSDIWKILLKEILIQK